jgi:phage terminase large subunit-like protein
MNSLTYTNESKRSVRLKPNKSWAPAFYTPRLWKPSDGNEIVEFAESHFVVTKGFRAGNQLEFTDWQRWLLHALFERRPDGKLRYRRALIGLPRKNGKSLLGSTIGIYGMVAGESGAEIYAVAGDRQQARIIFNEAKSQVMSSPSLSRECKIYRDALEMPRLGSVFRVLSSDYKGQAGLNPSLVLFDELWNQNSDELYDQMSLGSGARIEPMTISISTAGFDLDTPLGKQYALGKKIAAGEIIDESFGCWWWEAPAEASINDQEAWRIANPNIAEGLLDLEDLQVASRQTAESEFKRWKMNQWARSSESWLPVGAWERCQGALDLDPELPAFVGIDMAIKNDSIAVVIAQQQDDQLVIRSKVWDPRDEGIDIAGVEAHIRDLHLNYNIQEFAFDPALFLRSAEALADDGLPMIEFPQSAQRMIPACNNAYRLIVEGTIMHDGSPTLADHVLSATQRMTENGWRLSKGKSRRKIDACIAMVIAIDRATSKARQVEPPKVLDIWV